MALEKLPTFYNKQQTRLDMDFLILGISFFSGGAVGFLLGLFVCLWIAAAEMGSALKKAGEQ